jgi:hypothetical protein
MSKPTLLRMGYGYGHHCFGSRGNIVEKSRLRTKDVIKVMRSKKSQRQDTRKAER